MNNLDVQAIEKAVAYLDRVSFESLPILPTGACVLAGVSAQVPVVTRISPLPLEAEPNSRTMSVVDEWLSPLFVGSIDGELSDKEDLSDTDRPIEPPF